MSITLEAPGIDPYVPVALQQPAARRSSEHEEPKRYVSVPTSQAELAEMLDQLSGRARFASDAARAKFQEILRVIAPYASERGNGTHGLNTSEALMPDGTRRITSPVRHGVERAIGHTINFGVLDDMPRSERVTAPAPDQVVDERDTAILDPVPSPAPNFPPEVRAEARRILNDLHAAFPEKFPHHYPLSEPVKAPEPTSQPGVVARFFRYFRLRKS